MPLPSTDTPKPPIPAENWIGPLRAVSNFGGNTVPASDYDNACHTAGMRPFSVKTLEDKDIFEELCVTNCFIGKMWDSWPAHYTRRGSAENKNVVLGLRRLNPNLRCSSAGCDGGQVVWDDGTEFVFNSEIMSVINLDTNSGCLLAIWDSGSKKIAVHDQPCHTLNRKYLCEMYFY